MLPLWEIPIHATEVIIRIGRIGTDGTVQTKSFAAVRQAEARLESARRSVRATLAMLRTPDGQGIELDKFHAPNAVRFGPVDAPVNALGLRRIMFAVDDIDAVVARMQAHGAELIGQMQYEKSYRLAYIRGPEGIIVGLAEQLS
jgi:hypothetical protein